MEVGGIKIDPEIYELSISNDVFRIYNNRSIRIIKLEMKRNGLEDIKINPEFEQIIGGLFFEYGLAKSSKIFDWYLSHLPKIKKVEREEYNLVEVSNLYNINEYFPDLKEIYETTDYGRAILAFLIVDDIIRYAEIDQYPDLWKNFDTFIYEEIERRHPDIFHVVGSVFLKYGIDKLYLISLWITSEIEDFTNIISSFLIKYENKKEGIEFYIPEEELPSLTLRRFINEYMENNIFSLFETMISDQEEKFFLNKKILWVGKTPISWEYKNKRDNEIIDILIKKGLLIS